MAARLHRATYQWDGPARRRVADTFANRNNDLQVLRRGEGAFDEFKHLEAPDLLRDLAAPAQPMSTSEAFGKLGFPESGLPPDEDLIQLLVNAAEIEQGLMIQYLYAAATAGSNELATHLTTIAVEEMGHFMTVQNLLVTFGAAPHLAHGDWVDADFFKPFEFKLEAASRLSVAKYTVAEMPSKDSGHIDGAQSALLPDILKDAVASAGDTNVAAHRVGLLYMKIYWLLRDGDEPLPDGQVEPWEDYPVAMVAADYPKLHISAGLFQPANVARTGLLADWTAPGRDMKIRPTGSRADALQAIADLSAQGEGFSGSVDGHFDKFVRAWSVPATTFPDPAGFAKNPWYRDPAVPLTDRAGDEIINPLAIAFARMGDKAYEAVVLTIAMYLLLPVTAPATSRSAMAAASMKCMSNCLLPCMRTLGRLQVVSDPTGPRKLCGLPYLQSPLLVAQDAASVRARIGVLKDEIAAVAAEVPGLLGATVILKNTARSLSASMAHDVWRPVDDAGQHV